MGWYSSGGEPVFRGQEKSYSSFSFRPPLWSLSVLLPTDPTAAQGNDGCWSNQTHWPWTVSHGTRILTSVENVAAPGQDGSFLFCTIHLGQRTGIKVNPTKYEFMQHITINLSPTDLPFLSWTIVPYVCGSVSGIIIYLVSVACTVPFPDILCCEHFLRYYWKYVYIPHEVYD